jgi:5'-3' exonuclease
MSQLLLKFEDAYMIHYLCDTSWLLYRGYYALSHIYEEYPEIHFLCKKIESLLARQDGCVYLCLDGYSTKGRRLLGEKYKHNRCRDGQRSVYEALSSFVHLLHNDRIKIYFNNDYESDEIIFTLSRTLEGRKKIISGDKDILQSLKLDTVIDNGTDHVVTEESYKFEYADKFFEIEPAKLPIFRAIVGDVSDTLFPPVARFPRKLAANIVTSLDYSGDCPSVYQLNYVKESLKDSEKKWVDKLVAAYDKFKVNFDIMKLNVIEDNLTCDYDREQVAISDFLKSKIERLNIL